MVSGHLLARTAAAMAAHGWHVLPTAGKVPRTEHGVLEATTDPAIIRQWWSRWPDAGIGVACGPSGLLVVDLDSPVATAAWRDLSAEHGAMPTRTARTGRGWHLYYRQPAEGEAIAGGEAGDQAAGSPADVLRVGNSAGRLAPGIDTRGHGGYVIAPPSPHPDRAAGYTWHVPRGATGPLPVVDSPGWLIEQLTTPPPTSADAAARAAAAAGTVNDRYLRAAIAGEVRRVAAAVEGRRNHTLNAAAYALAGLGVPDDVIRARLADAAHAGGLDPVETDRTLTSAITAGTRNPRPVASSTVSRPTRVTGPGHGPWPDAAAATRDPGAAGRDTTRGAAMPSTALTPGPAIDGAAVDNAGDAHRSPVAAPAEPPATGVEARQALIGPDGTGALEPHVLLKSGAALVAQIHAAARDEARARRNGTTPPGSSHLARIAATAGEQGAGHPHHVDVATAARSDCARAAVDRGCVADWLDTRHPADGATGSWSAVGTPGVNDSAGSAL